MKFTLLFGILFISLLLSSVIAFNVSPLNSSITSQTTTVPLAYRAIVGIVIIIICVIAVWKFLKLFIGAILAFVILLILMSTAYYYFTTGTISVHNSLAFLEDIWQFFAGHINTIHSISSSVINTVANSTSQTNSIPANTQNANSVS